MNLKEYLKSNKITQKKFAKSIGCTRDYINAICLGKLKPGLHLSLEIERHTKGAITYLKLMQFYELSQEKKNEAKAVLEEAQHDRCSDGGNLRSQQKPDQSNSEPAGKPQLQPSIANSDPDERRGNHRGDQEGGLK